MSDERETLRCAEVGRLLGEEVKSGYLPSSCCASCHDDWAEGYDEPMDVELKDGRVAFVCCRLSESLEKAGLEYGVVSDERAAAIEARLAAATPGPWTFKFETGEIFASPRAKIIVADLESTERDMDLIANAPADLAYLLAEVKRLRETVERVTNAAVRAALSSSPNKETNE